MKKLIGYYTVLTMVATLIIFSVSQGTSETFAVDEFPGSGRLIVTMQLQK